MVGNNAYIIEVSDEEASVLFDFHQALLNCPIELTSEDFVTIMTEISYKEKVSEVEGISYRYEED